MSIAKPLRIPNSNKKKKDVIVAMFTKEQLDVAKKEYVAKMKDCQNGNNCNNCKKSI